MTYAMSGRSRLVHRLRWQTRCGALISPSTRSGSTDTDMNAAAWRPNEDAPPSYAPVPAKSSPQPEDIADIVLFSRPTTRGGSPASGSTQAEDRYLMPVIWAIGATSSRRDKRTHARRSPSELSSDLSVTIPQAGLLVSVFALGMLVGIGTRGRDVALSLRAAAH